MDESNFEGIGSLVRMSGAAVPARARFIGEALVSSTMHSLTFGLCGGLVGATLTPIGPLVPFLCASSFGYTAGLITHWRHTTRTALRYAKRYPTLLAHALYIEQNIVVPSKIIQASEAALSQEIEDDEEPLQASTIGTVKKNTTEESETDSLGPTLEMWIQEGGLGRLTFSVLAAQACRADVEEIQRKQRDKIMEEYQEKFFGS